jgi:hypothetical protein
MPFPRLLLALFVAAAATALPAAAAGTAAVGTRGCAEAVVRDWDRGSIGEHYAPACYRAALDGLPEDMRVYSSAASDIENALHARLTALMRRAPGAAKRRLLSARGSVGSSTAGFPMPVLVAAAGAALLVGLAGASQVARRVRRR